MAAALRHEKLVQLETFSFQIIIGCLEELEI